MVNICISRITGNSDYDNFGTSPNFVEDTLEENSNFIDFKYYYSKEKDVTTVIINGSDFKRWDKKGYDFINFFKNNNKDVSKDNGVSELAWLIDIFEQIIKMIDKSIWEKLNNKNKAELFIHWGGEGRYEATNCLNKTAKNLKSFPFDVITWSTQDKVKLSVVHLFNLDDSEEIIKSAKELVKSYEVLDVKKKIIEIKQKTILKWLPLAIDFQGLCEVNEKLRNNYFNDLKKNYPPEFIAEHKRNINEINYLLNKNIKTDEDKLSTLIDELKNNKLSEIEQKNHLNSKGKFFLPSWLEQLSDQFDKIIDEFDR